MDATDYTSRSVPRSFWDLSDRELAASCRWMAENHLRVESPAVRAEALRLFLLWLDTLNEVGPAGEVRQHQAALLSGLRKRTIQILVKLGRSIPSR